MSISGRPFISIESFFQMLHISIHWSQKTFTVDVAENGTGLDLKKAIQQSQSIDEQSRIRLIFSGKILADTASLSELGIKDNSVVHMVVSASKPKASAPSSTPTPPPTNNSAPQQPTQSTSSASTMGPSSDPLPQNPSQNPFGMGFPGMGFPMGGMGMPNMNDPQFMDMAQQLFSNPAMMEMAQTMMSDPTIMQHAMGAMSGNSSDIQALYSSPSMQRMMQSLTENPEMITQLMQSNPLFANNPQLQSLLNNPQLLQQEAQLFGNFGFGAPNPSNPTNTTNSANTTTNTANTTNTSNTTNSANTTNAANTNTSNTLGGNNNYNPYQAPKFDFNQCLLLQMLQQGSMTPDVDASLNNSEVQRGLEYIAYGISLCRKNGLKLFNHTPGIDDLKVNPSLLNQSSAGAPGQMDPRQRYRSQLQQLQELGYTDEQRNLDALIQANGDINRALDHLLN